MFTRLKEKFTTENPYEIEARAVYAACLDQVRLPLFYTDYGADDSFEGRFDLLLVHLFCVLHVAGGTDGDFNQALFDATFADMDQSLREMGIGDMGIPKHMRRMMKAFNGRMHRYEDAYIEGKEAMIEAITLNLYGTLKDVDAHQVQKMFDYIHRTIDNLKSQTPEAILDGQITFLSGETL